MSKPDHIFFFQWKFNPLAHHPLVEQPLLAYRLFLRRRNEGEVDEGVDVPADRAFIIDPQPVEDAARVELMSAVHAEVALGGVGVDEADCAVDLSLGRGGLHAVPHPGGIDSQFPVVVRLPTYHAQDLPLSVALLADDLRGLFLVLEDLSCGGLRTGVRASDLVYPPFPAFLVILCALQQFGLDLALKRALTIASGALEGEPLLESCRNRHHLRADAVGHVGLEVCPVAIRAEDTFLAHEGGPGGHATIEIAHSSGGL